MIGTPPIWEFGTIYMCVYDCICVYKLYIYTRNDPRMFGNPEIGPVAHTTWGPTICRWIQVVSLVSAQAKSMPLALSHRLDNIVLIDGPSTASILKLIKIIQIQTVLQFNSHSFCSDSCVMVRSHPCGHPDNFGLDTNATAHWCWSKAGFLGPKFPAVVTSRQHHSQVLSTLQPWCCAYHLTGRAVGWAIKNQETTVNLGVTQWNGGWSEIKLPYMTFGMRLWSLKIAT